MMPSLLLWAQKTPGSLAKGCTPAALPAGDDPFHFPFSPPGRRWRAEWLSKLPLCIAGLPQPAALGWGGWAGLTWPGCTGWDQPPLGIRRMSQGIWLNSPPTRQTVPAVGGRWGRARTCLLFLAGLGCPSPGSDRPWGRAGAAAAANASAAPACWDSSAAIGLTRRA